MKRREDIRSVERKQFIRGREVDLRKREDILRVRRVNLREHQRQMEDIQGKREDEDIHAGEETIRGDILMYFD